jgi:hypothetical protein
LGSVKVSRAGETTVFTSRIPRNALAYLLAACEKDLYDERIAREKVVKEDAEYERLIESGKELLAKKDFEAAASAFMRARSLKPNAQEPNSPLAEAGSARGMREGQDALAGRNSDQAPACRAAAPRKRTGRRRLIPIA